ncbi:leucyl aminopeptidase [Candidatus Woesearchaeota archaeon]|nr:leucyl aminopeptidase [Candidatus Woesearchaeota archaeon]
MAYIETVKKGKKNFYYLTQTIRVGNKFKKARVFLGKGIIPQKKLEELARKVEGSLKKEIEEVKKMKKNVSKKLNLTTKKDEFTKIATDLVVVPLFEEEKSNSFVDQLPTQLKKEVSELLNRKSLKGEFGEARVLNTFGSISAKNILLLGLGKEKELSLEVLRRASAIVLKVAKGLNFKKVVTTLSKVSKLNDNEVVQAIVEGTLLANYRFDKFKSKKDDKRVEEVVVLTDKEVAKGVALAEATNYTRELVNLPAAIVTPSYLGKEALKLKNKNTSVKVYGRAEIKRMGMNALLAVGSGSVQEQKFIVINYRGGGKKKIALVGKGITFDAGGLNLKPTRYIEEMKQDMGGAGAVLGVLDAVQKLKLKVNVLGIIPTCENLVGDAAYKPGDILTAFNKKTIEITNTDAEGRLILADALGFAEKQKPNMIIDIATLTGAVGVALGSWAVGLLSKDPELVKKLVVAGKESGERVWELPLWDDYKDLVKSGVADVCNSNRGHGAGVIEGGMFLSNFVEKTSFAHLDIGGTAWFNEDKFYFSKGGTGAGVRLLVRFLENL